MSEGLAGQQVVVSGSGFGSRAPLTATLNSTPVLPATLIADADGSFSVTVRIPQDATPGQHTIVVAGSGRSARAPFRVLEPASTGQPVATRPDALARTGTSVRGPVVLAALFLVLGNAALLWGTRQRCSLGSAG